MTAASVDDYTAEFPADVQGVLQAVRRRIHETLPGAGEKISYRIPTVTVGGRWAGYFAGWKDLSAHTCAGRGRRDRRADRALRVRQRDLRLPLDQPVPYDLITRLGGAPQAA